MFDEIKDFNLSILNTVISYITINDINIEQLINELGCIRSRNEIGTIVVQPKNSIFNTILLSVDDSYLKCISFHGKLSFSLNDLKNKYGKFREVYSNYDDLYFYFFNEQTGQVIVHRSEHKLNGLENQCLNQIAIDFR